MAAVDQFIDFQEKEALEKLAKLSGLGELTFEQIKEFQK